MNYALRGHLPFSLMHFIFAVRSSQHDTSMSFAIRTQLTYLVDQSRDSCPGDASYPCGDQYHPASEASQGQHHIWRYYVSFLLMRRKVRMGQER